MMIQGEVGKATPRQIGALRKHHNTSGFRGVIYDCDRDLFRAEIGNSKNKTRKRGPRRVTAIEAARDYDAFARVLYGKDAHLNFPDVNEMATMVAEPDPGRCAYGHDLTYYGYIDRGRPNFVNCRQCNAWSAKRYKQRCKKLSATS